MLHVPLARVQLVVAERLLLIELVGLAHVLKRVIERTHIQQRVLRIDLKGSDSDADHYGA